MSERDKDLCVICWTPQTRFHQDNAHGKWDVCENCHRRYYSKSAR